MEALRELSKLTRKEILGVAVKSEIEAEKLYSKLSEMVEEVVLKERLKWLKGEEEKHRKTLENLFYKAFPGEKISVQMVSIVPGVKDVEERVRKESSASELMKLAIEVERASEKFYIYFAEKSEDEKVKLLFEYLGEMERSHYYIVKSEYKIVFEHPEYIEMVHVGP